MDPVPPAPPAQPIVEVTPPPPPISTDFHTPPPPPPADLSTYAVNIPRRRSGLFRRFLLIIPLLGLAALAAYLLGLGNGVSLSQATKTIMALAATPTLPVYTPTPAPPPPDSPNGYVKLEQLKLPVMPQFLYSPDEHSTSYLTSARLAGSFQLNPDTYPDTGLVSATIGLSSAVVDVDTCKTFTQNNKIQSLPATQDFGNQTWFAGQTTATTPQTNTTIRIYHLYYQNICYELAHEITTAKDASPNLDIATIWSLLEQIPIHLRTK